MRNLRGLRLLAASPRFLKAPGPPRPAAPRGPSRVCRPRASKCARPYCGTARSVWAYRDFGSANCAPSAPSLLHDPARSVWAYRDFGSSICAPPAPRPLAGGRAQTQNLASSSILEAFCPGASSGAPAATRASSKIRAEWNRALQPAPPRQPHQGSQGGGERGVSAQPKAPKT